MEPLWSGIRQSVTVRKAYQKRYRRTLRFFAGLVWSLIFWEILVRRLLGARVTGRHRSERLRGYARRFRALALEMGGVMIKLGQFFSARVDVLPAEITSELAGLQDEVPPAPFGSVIPLLESELGPPQETFAELEHVPQAAASLGQVYRARLHAGERVIIKVQRPGIEDLVSTDLAALDVVGSWLMKYRPIRRRANIPALLEEFARTLWEELDYVAEADNARRFAEMFADDPEVYIPRVYSELTTSRVLTLEDVTCIKITDHAAIDRAGIDRHEVALRLFRSYMDQIFEHRFFHADPHPGNLFIYPLPEEEGAQTDTSHGPSYCLVFVDFGMVGRITDNVLTGLREAMLAFATRDMKRLVTAYQILGVLLPHADLDRIAQAEQKVFDRFWGMSVRQMVGTGYREMRELAREFSDLLFEMPFQVPQDLIYLGRALGILSGMCTNLDPEFNPWTALAPYAQKLSDDELRLSWRDLPRQIRRFGRVLLELPHLVDAVARQVDSGGIHIRTAPEGRTERRDRRLEAALQQVAWALVFAALIGSGTLLYLSAETHLGLLGYGLAGASLLVFLWRAARSG